MTLARDAIANMGLTVRKMLLGLLGAAMFLGTLFAFIFLGIASFGGAGNFGSSIRSAMVAASALGSSKAPNGSEDIPAERSDDAIKDALDVALVDS
jgi:hypothetical protein